MCDGVERSLELSSDSRSVKDVRSCVRCNRWASARIRVAIENASVRLVSLVGALNDMALIFASDADV